MIAWLPLIGRFIWRHKAEVAILLALLGLLYAIGRYGDNREAKGRAKVQVLWDADTEAREKVTAKAIADALLQERAARSNNEVIEREYQAKVAAATADRDATYRLLQQARNQVRSSASREATGALIAATAGEASIADRIDRAVAGVVTESRANADQLDALIAVVKPQM